jgi:hypothetical protein
LAKYSGPDCLEQALILGESYEVYQLGMNDVLQTGINK